MYGDGIEGWVPFVDGGSDGVALEAVDDEFFDLHLRDDEGAGWCEGCLLGIQRAVVFTRWQLRSELRMKQPPAIGRDREPINVPPIVSVNRHGKHSLDSNCNSHILLPNRAEKIPTMYYRQTPLPTRNAYIHRQPLPPLFPGRLSPPPGFPRRLPPRLSLPLKVL